MKGKLIYNSWAETRRQSFALFDFSWECVLTGDSTPVYEGPWRCHEYWFWNYKYILASRQIHKYGIHEKWGSADKHWGKWNWALNLHSMNICKKKKWPGLYAAFTLKLRMESKKKKKKWEGNICFMILIRLNKILFLLFKALFPSQGQHCLREQVFSNRITHICFLFIVRHLPLHVKLENCVT